MSLPQGSTGRSVFWTLVGIALGGLVVAGVAGIASGGYRPPASANAFDPVRIGVLVFLVIGTAAFGVLTGGGIVALRAGATSIEPGLLLFLVGLTIATAAMVPIFALLPPAGTTMVFVPLQIPLYVGAGMMAPGTGVMTVPAVLDAVRRRDRGLLVGLLIFIVLVALELRFRD